MFRNYITIAFRNFYKFRFYTLINVIGLTIGITACLVILLYVRFELSYDRFHENADRIVRVDWDLHLGEIRTHNAAVTPPMAKVLVQDFPEVELASRFREVGSFQFKRDIENTVEWRVVYADNDMFKIFTIPFIAGDPETALKDPHSMVITEKCAEQFFPNEDALGKTLIKDNQTLYKITGVVKDLPDNSHFHYRMFLSMEGLEESKNGNWIGGPFNTYLLLHPDADYKVLESKLPAFVDKYIMPNAESVLGSSFMNQFKSSQSNLTLHLRPLTDIHLHSHLRNELEGNGDIDYIYLFSAIAAFILIIACINFMNLATAEIGIRKVMGASFQTIMMLLSRDFGKLIVGGFLLAAPLAAYAIQWYLQDYAYKTSISWLIYIGAGLITFMLAMLTMGYQSIQAAKTNPTDALKSE